MSAPISAKMERKMPEVPRLDGDPGVNTLRRFVVDLLLPLRILHLKTQPAWAAEINRTCIANRLSTEMLPTCRRGEN